VHFAEAVVDWVLLPTMEPGERDTVLPDWIFMAVQDDFSVTTYLRRNHSGTTIFVEVVVSAGALIGTARIMGQDWGGGGRLHVNPEDLFEMALAADLRKVVLAHVVESTCKTYTC